MKDFIIASRTSVSIPQINFLYTTIKQMHYQSVVLVLDTLHYTKLFHNNFYNTFRYLTIPKISFSC